MTKAMRQRVEAELVGLRGDLEDKESETKRNVTMSGKEEERRGGSQEEMRHRNRIGTKRVTLEFGGISSFDI